MLATIAFPAFATDQAGERSWTAAAWDQGQFDVARAELSPTLPPGRPVLLEPTQGSTIFNQTPTLTWEATPRAQEYWVYVNDGTGVRINEWFSREATGCGADEQTCSLVAPVELSTGTTTRWWVRARNEIGSGDWSLERRFRIDIAPVVTIEVTATVQGGGGSITPPSVVVEPGETASFNLEPDTGYEIDTVTGCGGEANGLAGMVYTTGPITEACTVTATFVESQNGDLIFGRYLPLEDGSIIRDIETDLEWQRCSVGQTWDVGTQQCSGVPLWYTWSAARNLTADGGFRTPTIEELRTLVHCSNTGRIGIEESYVPCGDFATFNSPTIVEAAFPGTPAVNFWSASSFLDFPDYAWYVRFFSGSDNAWFKDYSAWVRLVRDEHPLDTVVVTATAGQGGRITPSNRTVTLGTTASFSVEPREGYVVDSVTGCGNSGHLDGTEYTIGPIREACTLHVAFIPSQGDGRIAGRYLPIENGSIIRDTVTELEWQRCAVGQTWDGGMQSCTGEAVLFNWNAASQESAPDGFRAPDIEELLTLVYCSNSGAIGINLDAACDDNVGGYAKPTIVQTAFPNTPDSYFWSSSPRLVPDDNHAWGVSFSNGHSPAYDMTHNHRLRLVRGEIAVGDFLVTATADTGGTITPSSVMVAPNATTQFELTPDTDYVIHSVSGCGNDGSLAGTTYTTGPITEACTITAVFAFQDPTVPPGRPVLLQPSQGSTVSTRPTLTWEATPGAQEYLLYVNDGTGVRINAWYSRQEAQCGAGQATCSLLSPVELNPGTTRWWARARNPVGLGVWSLERRFMVDDQLVDGFTVTATAGAGGSISPSSVTVAQGATAQFELTVASGYAIDAVTGCGGSLSGMTYTTGPITQACTVSATFVESGGDDLIAGRYLPIEDGSIIRDIVTELEWQRCSVGQTWDGGTQSCTGEASRFAWDDAIQETAPGGFQTPTIEQLRTLVYCSNTGQIGIEESSCFASSGDYDRPTIVQAAFPNTSTDMFWSASLYVGLSDAAWAVFFGNGVDHWHYKSYGNRLRLVRSVASSATMPLNDTGIDWCADDSSNFLDCPVESHPGQDGDFGRDALARAGQLTKVGGGAAGFDFTKLGVDGEPLLVQNMPWSDGGNETDGSRWSCVRDNVTGLIWEVKLNDPDHLQYRDHSYTWYQPEGPNGGDPGVQDGGNCVGSACDTQGYVQALNAQGLCGANDWRMPTVDELLSIVHAGRANRNIDQDYFPNTLISPHWTATTIPGHVPNIVEYAWYVTFNGGYDGSLEKTRSQAVLLVRGGQVPLPTSIPVSSGVIPDASGDCAMGLTESTPSDEFVILDNGKIVRHVRTGLEWQRCPFGMTWQDNTCQGEPMSYTWYEALDLVNTLDSTWRLPSRNELLSISERCRRLPAINNQVFPNTPSNARFRSSSSNANNADFAWLWSSNDGGIFFINKSIPYYIRLVRN